jgi:hypothetical protein
VLICRAQNFPDLPNDGPYQARIHNKRTMILAKNEISMTEEMISYPYELDDHVRLYGMRADEFKYLRETCPVCENRIDELGWCGHGNIGGG